MGSMLPYMAAPWIRHGVCYRNSRGNCKSCSICTRHIDWLRLTQTPLQSHKSAATEGASPAPARRHDQSPSQQRDLLMSEVQRRPWSPPVPLAAQIWRTLEKSAKMCQGSLNLLSNQTYSKYSKSFYNSIMMYNIIYIEPCLQSTLVSTQLFAPAIDAHHEVAAPHKCQSFQDSVPRKARLQKHRIRIPPGHQFYTFDACHVDHFGRHAMTCPIGLLWFVWIAPVRQFQPLWRCLSDRRWSHVALPCVSSTLWVL